MRVAYISRRSDYGNYINFVNKILLRNNFLTKYEDFKTIASYYKYQLHASQ